RTAGGRVAGTGQGSWFGFASPVTRWPHGPAFHGLRRIGALRSDDELYLSSLSVPSKLDRVPCSRRSVGKGSAFAGISTVDSQEDVPDLEPREVGRRTGGDGRDSRVQLGADSPIGGRIERSILPPGEAELSHPIVI